MVFLSPGVKSRELDYSTYVGQISSCIVGMVGGARRGALNYATLCTSPTSFTDQFGEPLPTDYAAYCAIEFLKKGNQLFYVRVADDTTAKGKVLLCDGLIEVIAKEFGSYSDAISVSFVSYGVDEDDETIKLYKLSVFHNDMEEETFIVSLDETRADFIENISSRWVTVIKNEPIVDIPPEFVSSETGFLENDNNEWELKNDITATEVTAISFETNVAVEAGELTVVSDSEGVLPTGSSVGTVVVDGQIVSITVPEGTFKFDTVVTPAQPEVAARYSFDSFADSTESVKYAHGEVEVVSVADGKTRVRVLSNTADNISPEDAAAFVGREFVVYGTEFVVNQGYDLLNADESPADVWIKVTAETRAHEDAQPAVYAAPWTKKFNIILTNENGTSSTETIVVNAVLEGEDTTVTGTATAGATVSGTPTNQVISDVSTPVYLVGGNDGCPVSIGKVMAGLQLLRNTEELDVNLIAAPGRWEDAIVNELLDIAKTRTDCLAIIDPPQGLSRQEVLDYHNGRLVGENYPTKALNTSYGAIFYPWVKVYDIYSQENVWLPPSGDVLAAFAYSDSVSQPWFAAAGLNRGMLDSVLEVEVDLDEGARDALYGNGNAVNAIVNYKRQGITIWGNRTLQRKSSALDRINVRRLMNMVRKSISATSAYLIFEQNDSLTWRQWKKQVDPYLESIKSSRGLDDYRTQMDEETVTDYYKDNNQMPGRVWIKPTKTAEFIQIDFILTSSGATFTE